MHNVLQKSARLGVVAGALLGATACDYTGDWLFAGAIEGEEPVQHLGDVEISTIETFEDFPDAWKYGEITPTGTPEVGGVTYTFTGTGGDVCVWVDPEAAYWVQSLSPTYGNADFAYPDNTFDDGDIDIEAGLAVFYTGSPGETFGTFEIRYEDSLGNVIPISANECTIPYYDGPSEGHAGKGYPEYCTMKNTQPGVEYLVAMETFATPIDDDRLAYGYMVAHGDCGDLLTLSGQVDPECVIPDETRDPSTGEPYSGTLSDADLGNFEDVYCGAAASTAFGLAEWCAAEADEKDCDVEHCFCGNPATQAPNPGDF